MSKSLEIIAMDILHITLRIIANVVKIFGLLQDLHALTVNLINFWRFPACRFTHRFFSYLLRRFSFLSFFPFLQTDLLFCLLFNAAVYYVCQFVCSSITISYLASKDFLFGRVCTFSVFSCFSNYLSVKLSCFIPGHTIIFVSFNFMPLSF